MLKKNKFVLPETDRLIESWTMSCTNCGGKREELYRKIIKNFNDLKTGLKVYSAEHRDTPILVWMYGRYLCCVEAIEFGNVLGVNWGLFTNVNDPLLENRTGAFHDVCLKYIFQTVCLETVKKSVDEMVNEPTAEEKVLIKDSGVKI